MSMNWLVYTFKVSGCLMNKSYIIHVKTIFFKSTHVNRHICTLMYMFVQYTFRTHHIY